MKFSVVITGENGKRIARVGGLPNVEDACATALALAKLRQGADLFVSVRYGDEHLDGVCCDMLSQYAIERLLGRSRTKLAAVRKERVCARVRKTFLMTHGGYDGPLGKRLFPPDLAQRDEELIKRYFASDFDGVLKRFGELDPVLISQKYGNENR